MRNKLYITLIAILSSCYSFAQLSPVGNSGQGITAYTDPSATNDPIYIWCIEGMGNNQASLSATPAGGTGPYTFLWYFHDQTSFSWTPYSSSTGASSTISNLPSDGYRVEIKDVNGFIIECYNAWVWNMNGIVTAVTDSVACDAVDLIGTVNAASSFTYYNPPPPESIIDASTQISVCFNATHTFISDLGFFLVGPAACGSPTIRLSPNPQVLVPNPGNCNSGDNVSNACFSSTTTNMLNVCTAGAPLSGTYGAYGLTAPGTLINWAPLIGCNAAEGGWRVQIYDCIGSDVGALTNAQITFSNLPPICGSPTTINYNSGAIHSTINDNSCTPASASIFQVPLPPLLTNPIVVNANVSFNWISDDPDLVIPGATSDLTPSVIDLTADTTVFTLILTVTYGTAVCTFDADTSFIRNCCTAVAAAGTDVAVCTGVFPTIGAEAAEPGHTYAWTPATGLSNPAIAQPTITTTNTTTSPITTVYTLTVTNDIDGGCQDTDEISVTINPLPIVEAGAPQTVCAETPVTLSGTGALTYLWDNGVTNNVAFPATATATYTVIGTDVNGCKNTDNVVVTVNPLPNVNAGLDTAICIGDQVTLSGSGAVTYTWSNNVTNAIPFAPTTTATYTVTGKDANNCQKTDDVTVIVNPLPNIQTGADQKICFGTPVTLTGTGGVSYVWTNGVTNGQAFVPQVGIITYIVTGTDANGCVETADVKIEVLAVPVSSFIADATTGFPALLVNFTNNSVNANSYIWNFGDNTLSTSASSQSHLYGVGIYNVTLMISNGICGDTSGVTITVLPYPDPVIHTPNVFTPNGDGANDVFWIDTQYGRTINVQIFNRWGNMVHEMNDFADRWDGKVNGHEVTDGVYFYKYLIIDMNGNTFKGQGNVTIER